HLYALHNYSNMHHTLEFLAQEIKTVVIQIGAEKICSVVSDNGTNVAAAQRLITQKFSRIVNVSCIAHLLNLICKDIMKESFSKRVLFQATLVVQFFKSSHIANSALKNEIQINNIVGQLAFYKLSEPPFNKPFEPDCQIPQIWWKTIEDVYDHLSTLAVKLFNIILHSVSYVLAIANEVEEFDNSDSDENSGEDDNDEIEIELLDKTLDLEEIFDLNYEIFKENGQNNIRSDSEHVAKEDPNYNYNIDDLVNEVFA
ncbi:26390_t:CDS:2, partial [Gigaspora margarita]